MFSYIAENFVFYSTVENYPPNTKVLRPRKKVIHNVHVSNVSGFVAYGSRSAKIQVPGGENSANATLPQTETLTGVEGVEYDREQQETEYDREQIHGSYCVYRRHSEPLFQDEKAPWKARARKGIVTNKSNLTYFAFYYIDTSVLLENIPIVKFIKTTYGTQIHNLTREFIDDVISVISFYYFVDLFLSL